MIPVFIDFSQKYADIEQLRQELRLSIQEITVIPTPAVELFMEPKDIETTELQ